MGSVNEGIVDKSQDILEPDSRLQDACEALRAEVDNLPNSPKIFMVKVDGVQIGYRLQVFRTFINRQIFIKTPGYDIGELSKRDKELIMTAIFNVFLIQGAQLPTVDNISKDCMLLQQKAIPFVPVERSPGLVSIAGGFGNGQRG